MPLPFVHFFFFYSPVPTIATYMRKLRVLACLAFNLQAKVLDLGPPYYSFEVF